MKITKKNDPIGSFFLVIFIFYVGHNIGKITFQSRAKLIDGLCLHIFIGAQTNRCDGLHLANFLYAAGAFDLGLGTGRLIGLWRKGISFFDVFGRRRSQCNSGNYLAARPDSHPDGSAGSNDRRLFEPRESVEKQKRIFFPKTGENIRFLYKATETLCKHLRGISYADTETKNRNHASMISFFGTASGIQNPSVRYFSVIVCFVLAHAMANASICGGSHMQTPKQKSRNHASMIPVFWHGVRDSNPRPFGS